jgi:hypothetical protein
MMTFVEVLVILFLRLSFSLNLHLVTLFNSASTHQTCFLLMAPPQLACCKSHKTVHQDHARYHKLPASADQFGGHSTSFWMNLVAGAWIHCNADPCSNIPTALALPPTCSAGCHYNDCKSASVSQAFNAILDEGNHNLSHAQKGFLLDHASLGHVSQQHQL